MSSTHLSMIRASRTVRFRATLFETKAYTRGAISWTFFPNTL
jgi:hypothetical protein